MGAGFGDAMLSALNQRPAEADLVVHTTGSAKNETGYFAYCSCGKWSMQAEGHDESSRAAIATGIRSHQGGPETRSVRSIRPGADDDDGPAAA
jgi:hypothetical protein